MTIPRATGVRIGYRAVPEAVRDWVDDELGSPVVEAHEQVGGMSPGCASRVRCADGTRAFVKAVGPELNPDTPNLFRREALTLGLLGRHPLWAGLHASYDEGGWVALVLEDVPGGHPDLTDDDTMDRLLHATDELVQVMAERVPDPPAPDPAHGGLGDLRLNFARWAEAFDHIGAVPPELAPRWLTERAGEFQERVAELAREPADHLVHWDIRNDNLLQRATGEIVFVDWGMAAVGPQWLDPLLARLERVEDPWFDPAVRDCPALALAGDQRITAWLLGIGTFLAWRGHTVVDVNLPTLSAFRRTESGRFLRAAARRLALPHDLGG